VIGGLPAMVKERLQLSALFVGEECAYGRAGRFERQSDVAASQGWQAPPAHPRRWVADQPD